MSDILINWLSQVDLSRKIQSIQKDFSNGYLFGELLQRYHQQLDFKDIKDVTTQSGKVQNFKRIGPTFKALGITLSPKITNDIMSQKKDIATNILYQLKNALLQTTGPVDVNVLRETGKINERAPAKVLRPQKEAIDNTSTQIYNKNLMKSVRAQKEIILEKKMQKFQQIQKEGQRRAEIQKQMQQDDKMRKMQQHRSLQINKMQSNAGFMQEWNMNNIQQWGQNQRKRKQMLQSDLNFKLRQAQKFHQRTIKAVTKARQQAIDQIDQFEQKHLKKVDKSRKTGQFPARSSPPAVVAQTGQNFQSTGLLTTSNQGVENGFQTFTAIPAAVGGGGLTASTLGATQFNPSAAAQQIAKIAQRKKMNELAKADRQSRTRKMMTSQKQKVVELQNYNKEGELLRRMERKSKQEEQLDYQIWRTHQIKNVIVQNRKVRETKFNRRKEMDIQVAQMKQSEGLIAMTDAFQNDLKTANERMKETETARLKAKRERHKIQCENILDLIISISDQAYIHQQKIDQQEFDKRNWHEWLELFAEGLPAQVNNVKNYQEFYLPKIQEKKNVLSGDGIKEGDDDDDDKKEQQEDEQKKQENQRSEPQWDDATSKGNEILDNLQFNDYLHQTGQWNQNIVSQSIPDLQKIAQDIALHSAGGAPAGGKGKGAAAAAGALPPLDPIQNAITSTAPSSIILGNVVKTLIQLNYEPRSEPEIPVQIPVHLPIKLCLTGRDFTGKETQAYQIARKYNLKVFILSELIEQVLKSVNAPIKEPLSSRAPLIHGEQSKSQFDSKAGAIQSERAMLDAQMSDGSLHSSIHNPTQQQSDWKLRMIGQSIKEHLMAGREIPDQLYVELIINKIVISFRSKPKEEIEEERKQKCQRMAQLLEVIEKSNFDLKVSQPLTGGMIHSSFVSEDQSARKMNDNSMRLSQIKVQQGNTSLGQQMVQPSQSFQVAPDNIISNEIRTAPGLPAAPGSSYKQLLDFGPNKDLKELGEIRPEGWILVDFPTSLNQAILLERALSSFTPELQQNDREDFLKQAERIAPPSQTYSQFLETLPKTRASGIDSIIWIESPPEQCLRRALGRRYHSMSDRTFHLHDNPPPINQSPLVEQLTSANQHGRPEGSIVDRHLAFREQMRWLKRWMNKFQNRDISLQLLSHVDGARDRFQVASDLERIVQDILRRKQLQENNICKPIADGIIDAKKQAQRQETERLAAEAAAEEEAKRLAQQQEQRKLKEQEQKAAEQAAATTPAPKDAKKGKKQQPAAEKKVQEVSTPPPPSAPQDEKKEQEKEVQMAEQPILYDNIDDDFKPVLMELWHSIVHSYKNNMLKSFGAIRGRREIAVQSFKDIQLKYLKFLNRDDDKQSLLNKFVQEFNKFSDERPDMREDQETKDQLHQRADTLCDQMASIIEQRKQQNIEERKKIIACGWFENEMEKIVVNAAELMQTEVDRFRNSQSLLIDYYNAIQGKLIPGLPQNGIISDVAVPNLMQIAQGDQQPLAVEVLPPELSSQSDERRTALLSQDQESGKVTLSSAVAYPRLDKLYERALRAQLPLEQKVDAPKGGKGAPAGKKGADKKAAVVQEQGDKEPSKYDNELKQGLNKERQLLRWRLTLIRNWCLQKIKSIRLKAEDIFVKFEQWARVAIRAQTDAVVSLSMILKQAIESHAKLQQELRISKMDFQVDSGIANFIEPPPEPHPPRQVEVSSRFPIPVLGQLINQLKSLADVQQSEQGRTGMIQAKSLVDAFNKLIRKSSAGFSDETHVPQDWANLNSERLQSLVNNLVNSELGGVEWKLVMTVITLLNSKIPNNVEVSDFQRQLTKRALMPSRSEIQYNEFVESHAWFDESQSAIAVAQAYEFPRLHQIKTLLFQIHQQNGVVTIQKFLSYFIHPGLSVNRDKPFSILFGK